jgi:succinyl-diaminopimelate desuccinylase
VGIGNALYHRKAQTHSLFAAGGAAPVKHFKHVGKVLFVNAASVIAHFDDRRGPFGLRSDIRGDSDEAVRLGEKYGYAAVNDDYYCVSFTRPGSAPDAGELGLLAHIDVVPEGSGWSYEPFNATLAGDFLVGRGTADNKGPAVVTLYTLRALDALDIKLNHSVRVIWGANEETGMLDIPHYLEKRAPPKFTLVTDAPFPLCYGEKGVLTADLTIGLDDKTILELDGGVVSNSIPDTAYILLDAGESAVREKLAGYNVEVTRAARGTKITARGKAGHAMSPESGESAITKLLLALADSGLFAGQTLGAFRFLSKAFSDYEGAGLGIGMTDELGTKTTHIGGYIRFRDGKLSQNINVRYAIRADEGELTQKLGETARSAGFEVENLLLNSPRYDSLDDPKLKLLLKITNDTFGIEDPPYTMGGGTHARKMPSSVPYGPWIMSRFSADEGQLGFGGPHGPDEAVDIRTLIDVIKIYVYTVIKLDELLQ